MIVAEGAAARDPTERSCAQVTRTGCRDHKSMIVAVVADRAERVSTGWVGPTTSSERRSRLQAAVARPCSRCGHRQDDDADQPARLARRRRLPRRGDLALTFTRRAAREMGIARRPCSPIDGARRAYAGGTFHAIGLGVCARTPVLSVFPTVSASLTRSDAALDRLDLVRVTRAPPPEGDGSACAIAPRRPQPCNHRTADGLRGAPG